MAGWAEVAAGEPEFAARVRALFDAHKHKTMATLRKDGSPRISGIEVEFTDDDVILGMMPGSLKAADVHRDPRVAVHSASVDPVEGEESGWPGDAKLAGRVVVVDDPENTTQGGHRFRIDISEVVLTRVGSPADHLEIESWHDIGGYKHRRRS